MGETEREGNTKGPGDQGGARVLEDRGGAGGKEEPVGAEWMNRRIQRPRSLWRRQSDD